MIISLTGFMGCGKTCTGKALAGRLGWEFIDLDAYLEHKMGRSVPELLSEGEMIFRAREAEAVRDIITMRQIKGGDLVLSLGGGTLGIKSVRPLILEETVCIYLEAGAEFLRGWLQGTEARRPLLDLSRLEEMLSERRPIYEQARFRVNAELSENEIIEEILKLI